MDLPFDNVIAGTTALAGADRYQPSLLTMNGRIGRLRYFTYMFARGSSGANRFGPAPVANSRRMITAAAGTLAAAFALGFLAGLMGVNFRGTA